MTRDTRPPSERGRGKAPPDKGAFSNKPESREQSNHQQRNGQQPPGPPGRAPGQPVATGRRSLTGLRAGLSLPCPLAAPSGAVLCSGTVFPEVLRGLGCPAAPAVPRAAEGMEGRYLPGTWAGQGRPTLWSRQHQSRDCGTAGVSLIRLFKRSFCQDRNNKKKPPILLIMTS